MAPRLTQTRQTKKRKPYQRGIYGRSVAADIHTHALQDNSKTKLVCEFYMFRLFLAYSFDPQNGTNKQERDENVKFMGRQPRLKHTHTRTLHTKTRPARH